MDIGITYCVLIFIVALVIGFLVGIVYARRYRKSFSEILNERDALRAGREFRGPSQHNKSG